jgi:hypothetical protein
MQKINISKTIFTKKTRDYTFVIIFLVVFSVFILAAIKPSLTTATSLQKEEMDLKKIDNLYENKISKIVLIQSQIEENRDNIFLLNEAVSQLPEVNKMVEDVKKVADKNNFLIKKANMSDVSLYQSIKKIDKVRLIIEGKTDFGNLLLFINDLFMQRRLKNIPKMMITKDIDASNGAELNVVLTIDGYYL